MKKLLPILAATTLVLTGCSDADTQQEEKTNTVNVAGQNWECQPVPDETMQRITVSYTHLTLPTNREV